MSRITVGVFAIRYAVASAKADRYAVAIAKADQGLEPYLCEERAMPVTAIRSIRNLTSVEWQVANRENPNDTNGPNNAISISPGQTVKTAIWIPWANSPQERGSHHIELWATPGNRALDIWQQGDYVEYQESGQTQAAGNLVPGNATVGGERSMEIVGQLGPDADIRLY